MPEYLDSCKKRKDQDDGNWKLFVDAVSVECMSESLVLDIAFEGLRKGARLHEIRKCMADRFLYDPISPAPLLGHEESSFGDESATASRCKIGSRRQA